MGKEAQEMRARKSRRNVSCVNCDKTMSWEYFRNHHVPTVHNGKKVPVKIISTAKAPGSSSNIRNLFASSLTAAGAVQDEMDKTRTDNEAGNSKDATVVEPEVNVS
ncbi:---NA--- [Paramuricea clavata]|uniref:---NA n=1 Tax=Paramuricea clavata TaxID=317549 RepID=A0A7D9J9T4_PARCT|nr:---NA--- [Paramuricea clavata]